MGGERERAEDEERYIEVGCDRKKRTILSRVKVGNPKVLLILTAVNLISCSTQDMQYH